MNTDKEKAKSPTYESQFTLEHEDYLNSVDFLNWFRYYYLIKDCRALDIDRVLEIGSGSGIVRNCLAPHTSLYEVLDINDKLKPEYVGDVRKFRPELEGRYDAVIAADVLEHIPFSDLQSTVSNLQRYLSDDGYLLLTIPHRRSNFLFMSPTYIPHVFTVPTGFLSLGSFYRRFIKRKIWIDPHHLWEIGDGTVKRSDVDRVYRNLKLHTVQFKKLLYVDYWILGKSAKSKLPKKPLTS